MAMSEVEKVGRAAANIVATLLQMHHPILSYNGETVCAHCHADLNSATLPNTFPCPTVKAIYDGTPEH